MSAQPDTILSAITRTQAYMERLRKQGEGSEYRFERQLLQRLRWELTKAEWLS